MSRRRAPSLIGRLCPVARAQRASEPRSVLRGDRGLRRAWSARGSHPDLFWALRGGGGNYGIVTAIEFGVIEVQPVYAGAYFFPFERAGEVLHTWNAIRGSFPDELMSWASLLHFPPLPDVPAFARGRSYAIVMAAFLGGAAEGAALLRPLRDLGPERDTFATVPPVVLGDLAMDPLDPVPFESTSALLDELPGEGIDALLAAVGPGSGRGPTVTLLQLRQMGGALSRVAPGAGARATLPGDISLFGLGAVFDEPRFVRIPGPEAPIDVRAVRACDVELHALSHALTDPYPRARGVALARALLTDGTGPLYAGDANALRDRAVAARAAL